MAKRKQFGKTRQKELLVLHAVMELGGVASKQATLNYIEEHDYYRHQLGDREPVPNRRDEQKWRINFAFRRKDLADHGALDSSERDHWRITALGRRECFSMIARAQEQHRAGVELEILSEAFVQQVLECLQQDGFEGSNFLEGSRTVAESEWHRETKQAIADSPELVGLNPTDVIRVWRDSVYSDDEQQLWKRLFTRKRPDVVFELCDDTIVPVEVEPQGTLLDGIGQLAGDYVVNLDVDRTSDGCRSTVRGILVTDHPLDALARMLVDRYGLTVVVYAA